MINPKQKEKKICKCGHSFEEHWANAECGADLEEGLTNVCEKCSYAINHFIQTLKEGK